VTRISSRWTTYHKRVFPLLWFGFLALFVAVSFFSGAQRQKAVFAVFPLFMGLLGFFIMKKLVWDLVDEVYDCGDYLLIKNRGEEVMVRLSNIMNVSVSTFMNPPRITLRLIHPVSFGDEIVFSPVTGFRLNPFAKNRVGEDLIMRVHRTRTGSAGEQR
jgi:hypothetical protein